MGKPGRNDPCSCGSGKKYKKCCLKKESAAAPSTPTAALKEANVNARLMAQKWMSALGGEGLVPDDGGDQLKLIRDEFRVADGNALEQVLAMGKRSEHGVLFYEGKQWIGEAEFSEEGKMVLTTADAKVANKLKGKLEKVSGLSHVGRTEDVLEAPEGGRRASAGAEMLAFKVNFFQAWTDETNERLGGLTPREAVADGAKKKELLKLLAELEKAESKLPKKERYSFKGIRKELGL